MRWNVFCQSDPFYDIAFYPYCAVAQLANVFAQRLQDRDVLRREYLWRITTLASSICDTMAHASDLSIGVLKVTQTYRSIGYASLGFEVATFRRRVLEGGSRA